MPDIRVSEWIPCGATSNPIVPGCYQVRRTEPGQPKDRMILWSVYNARLKTWGAAHASVKEAIKFQFLPSLLKEFEWRSKL